MERGNRSGNSNCPVGLHLMKLTLRLPNGTATICTTGNHDECGPGYYCTGSKCTKCHGTCDWCNGGNATDCIKCSRFSKEWQTDSNSPPTLCTLSYFDASLFNAGYTFTNIPPIQGGRATVGVWMFIGNLGSANRYMHIVVKDNIVLTVETSSSNNNVVAYCSIGQMYHTLLSNPALEDTTSNANFTTAKTALTANKLIVSTTATKVKGKWFYLRCAVNTQNKEFYVMKGYNKGTPFTTNDNGYTMNAGWQDELIFSGGIIQTDMKFWKYYRSTDTISVYINNINAFNSSNMEVYLKNLHVFSDYIPRTVNTIQYL
jgi:hypothetical protein